MFVAALFTIAKTGKQHVSIHKRMDKEDVVYTHTHTHTYIYKYICVCVCVCVYIYIHTHTHIHIHTQWNVRYKKRMKSTHLQ